MHFSRKFKVGTFNYDSQMFLKEELAQPAGFKRNLQDKTPLNAV
jgi:hypothetical protein